MQVIKSMPTTNKYRDNYDRIFRKSCLANKHNFDDNGICILCGDDSEHKQWVQNMIDRVNARPFRFGYSNTTSCVDWGECTDNICSNFGG